MVYRTEDGSPSGREDIDPSLGVDALVVRAQNGNQYAFEALYTRYSDQINNYLTRLVGNDGVGCELTQEVFLKAWSALPGLRSPEFFLRWLYRIALNCARDYQKHLKHVRMIPLDVYNEGGPEGVENAELVQIALSYVSPMYRSCLILYVIEGLPQQQIAERLNIKEVCVSKYVSRGKEELRQIYHRLLKGQGGGPPKGRRER
jgi:RNA polymerase sigma-70 factor (ECF subfamily)